jgi:hypothetical protein
LGDNSPANKIDGQPSPGDNSPASKFDDGSSPGIGENGSKYIFKPMASVRKSKARQVTGVRYLSAAVMDRVAEVAVRIRNDRVRDVQEIETNYAECFKDEIDFRAPTRVPIEHTIITEGTYKRPYVYPVARPYWAEAKKKIEDMVDRGMLRPSSSAFTSPLTCALKKDGRLRLCGDFRALNKVTVPDNYSLPRIDHIKQNIVGNVFSVIDLKEGFYQVPIAPDSIARTAMSTPWGLYEYLRMPFGLRNAPPTFQRFMNQVIRGLPNMFVYVDDIVLFDDTYDTHKQALHTLFGRLREYGLVVNKEKSQFFAQSIDYLGFEITPEGYKPLAVVLPKINSVYRRTNET